LTSSLQTCSRCIYDQSIPGIEFDNLGICTFCRLTEQLESDYQTATPQGEERLNALLQQVKKAGRGRKYDCIVGVSGGTDSSYLVAKAVELGLRPLAVHYDNTWNSSIATENIRKVLGKLKVDLWTYVVDNREMDDIFLSFLKASVPELDGATDIALAETLYRAAAKFGVNTILEGHSFRTEGVSPLGLCYVDGRYIASVHSRFGSLPMRTFPNMPLGRFLKWSLFHRIQRLRPFWYLDYTKEDARDYLSREFGWQYYGGHHLENRMTAFHHSYYLPNKFQVDQRNNSLSASVRSGRLPRSAALEEYAQPPHLEEDLLEYVLKRLNLSQAQFQAYLDQPPKSYRDYPTYKATFERLAPLFSWMVKKHLVPKSFYVKYCLPDRRA
jgi:N-acetyl sugar amidotransferase